MRSIRFGLVIALTVVGVMPAAADPLKLGPKTWAAYQKYLEIIGETGRGAFAVATDGMGGGGSYCEVDRCAPKFKATAIENCERANPGYKCVIAVVDRTPEMEFVGPE